MRPTPRVSVIMNCYNSSRFLKQAIDSVVAQTFTDWELIVWDNQSTDATPTIAAAYQDARIRYFLSPEHTHLGEARNLALRQAAGEFITFLDTDDLWASEKLSVQVDWFEHHPDVGFLYSNFERLFEDGSRAGTRRRTYLLPQPTGHVLGRFLKACPVNLQTVMLRRSLLDDMPEPFDPKLQISEEYDLFMRLFVGCEVGYQAQVLATYRVHPAQDSRRKLALYPVEHDYILDKLEQLYPDTVARYAAEFSHARAKIAYYRSRAASRNGDTAEAKELLRPHRLSHWKLAALYLLMCLPGNAFERVHRLTGRYH